MKNKWSHITSFEPFGSIPQFSVKVKPKKEKPELVVLLPRIGMNSFSAGPNTVFRFAAEIAKAGYKIQCVGIQGQDCSLNDFHKHLYSNLRFDTTLVKKFYIPKNPCELTLYEGDRICATASWTVSTAIKLAKIVGGEPAAYFIQDAEPFFLGWGPEHAELMQTYSSNLLPIINTSSLAEMLFNLGRGSFTERGFQKNALVFQPAVDRYYFYPEPKNNDKRTLFVYARFGNQEQRNLYQVALEAVYRTVQMRILDPRKWDIVCYGTPEVLPIDFGRGCVATMLPSLNMKDYASHIRHSDIVLYLVLSPHTGYMPLEASVCGNYVVTNTYLNKTKKYLRNISSLIIPASPTIEDITAAILVALKMSQKSCVSEHINNIPLDWEDSFKPIIPKFIDWMNI